MKLKKKLSIAFISIALIPYILGMALLTWRATHNIKQSRITMIEKYSATLTNGIQGLFSKLEGIAATASRFPAAQQHNWSILQPAVNGILTQNPEILEVFMVDTEGSHWNSSVTGNPYQGYRPLHAPPSEASAAYPRECWLPRWGLRGRTHPRHKGGNFSE